MAGTRTSFTNANRSGSLRYATQSKFQTLNYWVPDWVVPQPMKVAFFSAGGTLYNPGTGALEITSGSRFEELALMLSNDLGCVIVTHDYRPGGWPLQRGQDPERLFFPEVLQDFVTPIQYLKGRATDETVWGAANSISLDPDNWGRFATSSGAWAAGLTQLMPEGLWEYGAPFASRDTFTLQHNHLCNSVVTNIGQTTLSALGHGTSSDTGFYPTYGEYGWPGAYMFSEHIRKDSAPIFGWAEFPAKVKRLADWGEWISSNNTRALDCGFYLSGTGSPTTGFPSPHSLTYDPIDLADSDRIELQYWRFNGDPEGTPIDAGFGLTPRFVDLHDPAHSYIAFKELLLAGNTISKLEAGSSSTNLEVATRHVSNSTTFVANVKTWLTGTRGWSDPV